MRFTRILAVAITSTALMLPVVATSSASAEAARKPHRTITAKIVNPTPQTLALHAHVVNYPVHHTFLVKKLCATCTWKIVARKNTTRSGRVFYRVGAPATGRWYYRVGTPETARYATSYSQKFYTYRF